MVSHPSPIVRCDTTVGSFTIELHPEWAPLGAQRVADLAAAGYFDGVSLNRVNPKFLVQFGIRPPDLQPTLHHAAFRSLRDDPKRRDNPAFTDGVVSFAGSGPNSRLAQIFITYGTQPGLGHSAWEVPVGIVPPKDMRVVRNFYSAYGDMPPWGHGPAPQKMQAPGGQAYLDSHFPFLTRIRECRLEDTAFPPTPRPQAGLNIAGDRSFGHIRSGIRDVIPVRRTHRSRLASSNRNVYITPQLFFYIGVLLILLSTLRWSCRKRSRDVLMLAVIFALLLLSLLADVDTNNTAQVLLVVAQCLFMLLPIAGLNDMREGKPMQATRIKIRNHTVVALGFVMLIAMFTTKEATLGVKLCSMNLMLRFLENARAYQLHLRYEYSITQSSLRK